MTVARLALQTRQADTIVVSAVTEADVVGLDGVQGLPLKVIFGPKGLASQRNAGIHEVPDCTDILAFFDDDFLPAADYLEKLDRVFSQRPTLVGATGKLIADGIKTPGISYADGVAMVEACTPADIIQERALPALYGCNLCVRFSAARDIWFDEHLPLYGWQEDVDFSFQVGKRGTLIYTNLLTGVHLGEKGGRTSGKRLGYSQIANPIYLLRKKTIPPRLAWRLMLRNLAANFAYSIFPEPYVDRFGRLRGNARAIIDLARGEIHPERILTF